MASLTAEQCLSLLSDSDLANVLEEQSFYQFCASALRAKQGALVRVILSRRIFDNKTGDAPLVAIVREYFDGDPLNLQIQIDILTLYKALGLLESPSYVTLMGLLNT